VALNETYSVDEDTTLTVPDVGQGTVGVLDNDTDVEGSQLFAFLDSGPSHGTLALNDDGSFIYTPDDNVNDPDSFTYFANDGTVNSATAATVSIIINPVNDAPVITETSPQEVTMDEDGDPTLFSLTLHAADIDDDSLTWSISSPASNGTASASGTGNEMPITYTPDANHHGLDSFIVQVSDGAGGTDTCTVDVIINSINDAPVAVDDNYTFIKGPPRRGRGDYVLEVSAEDGVLANDTDADGDSLTAIMVTRPIRGGMTFRSDGSFRYRLNDEFEGTVSFTYQVSDGNGGTDTATVTIIVEN
jgi:VCBS repeat-containing protein